MNMPHYLMMNELDWKVVVFFAQLLFLLQFERTRIFTCHGTSLSMPLMNILFLFHRQMILTICIQIGFLNLIAIVFVRSLCSFPLLSGRMPKTRKRCKYGWCAHHIITTTIYINIYANNIYIYIYILRIYILPI